MSNDYVIASAQFLKESWYKENAGTPEAQESKFLEQIFEQIVDYCLDCDIELDDSIEIANTIIEENLVEEFYEEFLIENPVRWTAEGPTGSNKNARPYGAPGTIRQTTTVNRRWGEGMPAGPGERGYNPTTYNTARARISAQKANAELNKQLRTRDTRTTSSQTTQRSRYSSPTIPSSRPAPKPSPQGLTTVGGQGVATNTGSLPKEPQAPVNLKRPIISSIFKDKSNPLKTESTENFFSEQGMMDLSSVRRERERFTQSRNQGSTRTRTPQRTSPASTQTTPSSVNLPRSGNASIINRIYSNSPDIRTRWNWLNAKPSPATSVRQASTTSTTPRQSPIATTSTVSPRTGSTPTVPRTTPTAPTARASTLSSRSNATASVRPIVPTAPARATEPTAPPVTRPTMARLGQGERDSIFNREGGRQEYERRMIQAIRSGRRYQPAASTGTPTMNAPRTLGGGVSA